MMAMTAALAEDVAAELAILFTTCDYVVIDLFRSCVRRLFFIEQTCGMSRGEFDDPSRLDDDDDDDNDGTRATTSITNTLRSREIKVTSCTGTNAPRRICDEDYATYV